MTQQEQKNYHSYCKLKTCTLLYLRRDDLIVSVCAHKSNETISLCLLSYGLEQHQ